MTPEIRQSILAWFVTGEVGRSSKALAGCLAGIPSGNGDHPHDPDDLRRCLLLLDQIPEARPMLGKVCVLSPAWEALYTHWAALEATFRREVDVSHGHRGSAPETSALMRKILRPIEEQATEAYWEKRKTTPPSPGLPRVEHTASAAAPCIRVP